jgi:hypothetical protein
MNMAAGFNESQAITVAYVGGVGEIMFGLMMLILWRQRWPLLLSAALMVGLLFFAITFYPILALSAFNPVTTNICVFCLSIVAYRLHNHVPSSRGHGVID